MPEDYIMDAEAEMKELKEVGLFCFFYTTVLLIEYWGYVAVAPFPGGGTGPPSINWKCVKFIYGKVEFQKNWALSPPNVEQQIGAPDR